MIPTVREVDSAERIVYSTLNGEVFERFSPFAQGAGMFPRYGKL